MNSFKARRCPCFGGVWAIALGTLLGSTARAQAPSTSSAAWDTQSDTWVATDALKRTLPTFNHVGAPKINKTVGIFYFLWQPKRKPGEAVLDISKILAENPENPKWGPLHAFHWWSEPQLGYYSAGDPFVVRKHAQMLSDAGVDVFVCDITNALTYPEAYLALCETFTQIRRDGGKTPQISFMAHAKEGQTVQKLYDEFYGKNLYPELWFRWLGKPLILAKPENLTPALREFFTLRESWAWSNPGGWFADGKDKWPWLDNTPQQPGWHDAPDRPEQIVVAVAQHPTGNIGRSHQLGKQPAKDAATPEHGLYFAEQWNRAHQVSPPFVFVTGWNEWIAQRFESGPNGGPGFLGRRLTPGETFFVDLYTPEFSRDIEPMKGGFGDNYYYQLAANIRRYKGASHLPRIGQRTIRPGDFNAWSSVAPEYRDDQGDAASNSPTGTLPGRNDIISARVTYDTANLYFYIQTRKPLTTPATREPAGWMTLLLDTNENGSDSWMGYEWALNMEPPRNGKATLHRHKTGGGWDWETVSREIAIQTRGREMMLTIPRALLGMADLPPFMDFKWADNCHAKGDWTDFTMNGDTAPNARFNYRAQFR